MDFLKSAIASTISKGSSFPYSFGDRVDIDRSIWTLYNGTRREDGSACSIFSFDINHDRSSLPLAKNAVRKFRTLRHPGIVKVLETEETDSHIYIATERLVPLGWHVKRNSLSEETSKWGLHAIASTLRFINGEASSVHGSVRVQSVFTSESGEWKLGGLDILSSMKEDDAIIYSYGNAVPDGSRYAPPEITKTGWDVIKRNPISATDAYGLGILIFEVFNGHFNGGDELNQTRKIPPSMHQAYKRLIGVNPKVRLSVAHFLEQGCRHGGFFDTPLIHLTEGIDSLGLKSENEREEFLQELEAVSDDFPEEFFQMKVLPELLKSAEFGGGGPKVFSAIMRIGTKLSDEEFNSKITPVVIRLFSNPDRAIRVCLLDNLPLMIDHLQQKTVNDKIFPQMVTGFTDVAPIVREQTLKAVLTIINKLSDRIINGELLRYLAKTANDEQPGIRTNTTICLGKIARNLGTHTRSKVLVAAFTRSLRDPFFHARNAGLMALTVTSDLFSEEDCAMKILPSICPSLLDKEKSVRDQANKTLEIFLIRVRDHAETMPDTELPPLNATGAATAQPHLPTPQNGASWAGWAISSFTNKITAAHGDMQSKSNSALAVPSTGTSTPPISQSRPSSAAAAISRPTQSPLTPAFKRTINSSFPSTQTEDDDINAWGEINDDDNWDKKDDVDEWGNSDSFFDAPSEPNKSPKPTSPLPSFDDGSEPDFAGWLNAQAQAKSKAKKPLPKGLAKLNARPPATKRATTGSIGTKKTVNTTVKPKAIPKKIDTKPKQEEAGDDDGWGAWD